MGAGRAAAGRRTARARRTRSPAGSAGTRDSPAREVGCSTVYAARCDADTCCVLCCSQDGDEVRPSVRAGGAIFCSSDSRELAVSGGWLTCGCNMPCSNAHRPSVITRSPIRTRKEPPAIPDELETPGAMRGDEVTISTCSCVLSCAACDAAAVPANCAPLPLPLPATPDAAISLLAPDASRLRGGGEGGAKLRTLGASAAPPADTLSPAATGCCCAGNMW